MELYDHPANQFVAGFIGSPPMNFFQGTLSRKARIFFNEGRFAVRLEDAHAAKLNARAGQPVVFESGPRRCGRALYGQSNPEQQVKAKVEVVEPMGSGPLSTSTPAK
jgi:multiple sugar transport system ATP-binding protein